MRISLAIIVLCMAGVAFAADEQDFESIGAERARIGNARIQQDMERRALEEERQLAAAQPEDAAVSAAPPAVQEPRATAPQAASPPPAVPVPAAPANSNMSETLELLQKLGELKDAGYVSEDEYNKLKQKVLADAL